MRFAFTLCSLVLSALVFGQSYTSFLTGDSLDVSTNPEAMLVLSGGAGENDDAMVRFLEGADGGDVVVLRASGSDGYNDYMFSELGVGVNSVETILFNSLVASTNAYVLDRLQQAEAIWLAGGDQWDYVSYWKNTEVENIINEKLHLCPVGGISAGMAVLGTSYFTAQNGTVYSDECLEDPFNQYLTLGHNDFLETEHYGAFIADTHYDDPDRRGRHAVFTAHMWEEAGMTPLGIACDEYAAVVITPDRKAWCYGEFPDYDDFVYFLRPGCSDEIGPEVFEEGSPVSWIRGEEALKVYRVDATVSGAHFLDLSDWLTGAGGTWEHWWIEEGLLQVEPNGSAPECNVETSIEETDAEFLVWEVYPVPASNSLTIKLQRDKAWSIADLDGRLIAEGISPATEFILDTSLWSAGTYVMRVGAAVRRFSVIR